MTIQRPGFGTIDLDFRDVKYAFQFSLKDSHVYLLFMKNGDHYVLDNEEFLNFECEVLRTYGVPKLSHMWVLGENNANWWDMED